MNNYKAPSAQIVSFAAIDIIATSTPSVLNTWGENIEDIDANKENLFE